MSDFSANVLRERFTIEDIEGKSPEIVALSNRIKLNMVDSDGKIVERYVIRGQMLHTVVRFAGSLYNAFHRTGPLLNRQVPLDFDALWDMAAGTHERTHNADLWIAVYHTGKVVYQRGEHHMFLDVIEKCEERDKHEYESSLRVAEDLFNQAGRAVTINHESNIATTFQIGPGQGRSALILRGAQKTSTFVFHAEKKSPKDPALNPVNFISTAAAFLEGIQLSYIVGAGNEKLRREMIDSQSDEAKTLRSAQSRLGELNATIRSFENLHNVHYRPEKPAFHQLITTSEISTKKRLDIMEAEAEEEARLAEMDAIKSGN